MKANVRFEQYNENKGKKCGDCGTTNHPIENFIRFIFLVIVFYTIYLIIPSCLAMYFLKFLSRSIELDSDSRGTIFS